jgi:hypothetical protein
MKADDTDRAHGMHEGEEIFVHGFDKKILRKQTTWKTSA